MIKSRGSNSRSSVTFVLDPEVEATRAAVCGEWDGWATEAHPMERAADGGFRLTVELPAGRTYRFRYLLDGERWENDWAADAYVPNGFGGEDSLVDLTALAEDVPAVTGATSASKSSAAKSSAAKSSAAKSSAAKSSAAKSSGAKSASRKASTTKAAAKEPAASKAAKKGTKKSP
jgi:hypothetical protein